MGFWSTNQYTDILNLPEEKLIMQINSITREDLIEWLSWNDPNGIYRDAQSLKELGKVMSREEGIEIFLCQVADNRVP